jgi:hypothetical protein
MATTKRQCPNCKVTLSRPEWSKLWWMSSGLSGRLVAPCNECGTLLRLSSSTLVVVLSAIGLLTTSTALVVTHHRMLLIVALACAMFMLIGVLGTRVETAHYEQPVLD